MIDVEDGRTEPLPDYVADWQIARWMGVTRGDLDDMPLHEIAEARIVMSAENEAQRNAREKK